MDILHHVHAAGTDPSSLQQAWARMPYDKGEASGPDVDDSLAHRLGWFSVALGALELSAPHAIATWLGVPDKHRLIRTMGARGVANGIGLLSQARPVGWMWSRVVGDAMDLALLAAGARGSDHRRRLAASAGLVAGVMAFDLVCATRLSRAAHSSGGVSNPLEDHPAAGGQQGLP